jgi:hypothetical protein
MYDQYCGEQKDDLDSEEEDSYELANRTVSLKQVVDFMVDNFDLADYVKGGLYLTKNRIIKRVAHMLETIAIHGLGYNPHKLQQRELIAVFRERIEVKVPLSAYL